MEKNIVHLALENLKKHSSLEGTWEAEPVGSQDGIIRLTTGNQIIRLHTEVKTELRNYQLPKIEWQAKAQQPFIVVAENISQKIKNELRSKNIGYLETSGNIYLATNNGIFLWIERQKPTHQEKAVPNRAFTKTGLKAIFNFLTDEALLNQPYRDIAATCGVALGNVKNIITGLIEMGYLIRLDKHELKLINKKTLFEKWMSLYAERLKPSLLIGTFRFLKEEDFMNWKKLPLKANKTWWGGEPAGDLLTNFLHPEELTLYTAESRIDLIKNYRLVPDENGSVKAYRKFWQEDIMPFILVYADLMNMGNRRCQETAQKIYDEFIQNKL